MVLQIKFRKHVELHGVAVFSTTVEQAIEAVHQFLSVRRTGAFLNEGLIPQKNVTIATQWVRL